MKTPTDLVKDGIDQYTKGDIAGAESSSPGPWTSIPTIGTSYYYLGLIAYCAQGLSQGGRRCT